MKGTLLRNDSDLCLVEYKSGKTEKVYLTPKERTLLILSSKKDCVMVCVPVNSTIRKYKGMHCTLLNQKKRVFA